MLTLDLESLSIEGGLLILVGVVLLIFNMNYSSWIHVLVFLHISVVDQWHPPAQVSSFVLKSIFEKDKLNRTNFTTWYKNLRIVLRHDKKEHVLDDPLPKEPAESAKATTWNATRNSLLSLIKSVASWLHAWSQTCNNSSRKLRPSIWSRVSRECLKLRQGSMDLTFGGPWWNVS